MESCIFCKIRDRIVPKEFVYEDKDVMVFPDIHPLKPVHLLIISKKHIKDFLAMNNEAHLPSPEGEASGGQGLMMKLTKVIQEMIKKEKLENKGYRVVINGGGAQFIDHLHFHLLGPLSKTAEM